MTTKEILTTVYKLDVDTLGAEGTMTHTSGVILPVEIHHIQDGPWVAVYVDDEDVEYPDLIEFLADHCISYDSVSDFLAECECAGQYMREYEIAYEL